MMEVHFSIHGPIAGRVLRLNSSVQLPEAVTLANLLEVVHPEIGVDLLTLLREGREHPVILLNGLNLELPSGLEQQLQNEDEVVVLQAIAGG